MIEMVWASGAQECKKIGLGVNKQSRGGKTQFLKKEKSHLKPFEPFEAEVAEVL